MTFLDTNSLARSTLVLGDARVDVGRLTVVGRGEAGKLAPKSMSVLVELARYPEQTVTRAELLDRAWPDTHPTPDVLSHAIRELRRALGDDARTPRYIETVHGLGYRLLVPASIEETERVAHRPIEPAPPVPAIAAPQVDVAPAPEPAAEAPPPARSAPRRWKAYAIVAAVLVSAFLVAGPFGSTNIFHRGPGAWTSQFATSDPGAEEFPKLSPDGETLVFTRRDTVGGRWDLSILRIDGKESKELTSTANEDELWPAWSPDGERLAFLHIEGEQCSVEVMRVTGEERRSIAACDRMVFSALEWSPDGRHVLTSLPSAGQGRELRLHRIPVNGGDPEPIEYRVDRAGWDRDPVYSPDGRSIAFRRGLPPDYDVFVIPSEGGQARRLTHVGSVGEGLTWMPDGNELVIWSQHEGLPALYRVDVESGVLVPTGLENATRPNVSRNGARLAYQRPWYRVGMVAADVQRPDAGPVPLSESTGSVGVVANSADRQRVAYVSDRGGFQQVWVHEAGRKDRAFGDEGLRHITSLDWSDDGNQILLVVRRRDADHALVLDIGTGEVSETGLARPLLRDAVGSASPDRMYAIVQGEDRPLIARFDRENGEWRESVSEIAATELIRMPGVPGVFGRTPLRPNVIVQVGEDLSLREISLQPRVYGWTANEGVVWYIASKRRAHSELRRLDLASGEDRYVREMPHYLPRRRAGMAKLGDQIVLAVLVDDRADVGLVELAP